MVFQEESTFPWRTVIENVAFPLEIAGMGKAQRHEKARHFITLVGLAGFEKRYPAELSGGMRQRVAIARTLASEPKILLMDEPFAALDEQTRLLLGDKVLQIQQELKQTTLLITHNITEAVQLADRVLVMTYRPGRVKRMVDIDLPRPRTSEIVSSDAFGRYVAQIWATCARRRAAACATTKSTRGGTAVTAASATIATARAGFRRRSASARLSRSSLAVEILIRAGVVNRFIVPMPSQIAARVRARDRRGGHRRRASSSPSREALSPARCSPSSASRIGMLLYRVDLLRAARPRPGSRRWRRRRPC